MTNIHLITPQYSEKNNAVRAYAQNPARVAVRPLTQSSQNVTAMPPTCDQNFHLSDNLVPPMGHILGHFLGTQTHFSSRNTTNLLPQLSLFTFF
jgi:hypothetical protein